VTGGEVPRPATADLQARPVDAGPLVRALCEQLDVRGVLDRMLAWDDRRCKLSPGTRILALILSCFLRQRPLYRVGQGFHLTDCELLLGRGVTPEDLNDDALGRALDKLAAAGPRKVFSALCARAVAHEGVARTALHWDSTTRSFYGEYATAPPAEVPRITHGYSKDRRPDLKQVVLSLLTDREGFPLWGAVHDGNASDKKLHTQVLGEIATAFAPRELRRSTYVADSAFVTAGNLEAAARAGLNFLSRLPETYAVADEVKAAAWAGAWEELGAISPVRGAARYQASEQRGTVHGRTYRLVVYRSSHLDRRKQRALEAEVARTRLALEKQAAQLARQQFACRADAEAAAAAWRQTPAYHRLEAEVVEERLRHKRPGPGRPRKEEQPRFSSVYRVRPRIAGLDERHLAEERQRRSTFVLITTVPPAQFSAHALLLEYKHQSSLERRFAFLKDPEIVDSFFLKKPERVQALGYVLLMVCLIFSVLERRVRQTAAPLPTIARGPVVNPTGLEVLRNLAATVIRLPDAARVLSVAPALRPTFDAILQRCRVPVAAYTQLPP
jgi:transposase